MPRAGEGRSIRIDPEVYEALLTLKRGNMTFSDVIAQMLHDVYGWSDDLPDHQCDLEEFTGSEIRKSPKKNMEEQTPAHMKKNGEIL